MSPIPDDPNQAQAWISGEAPDQTIDFYIPRGNRGPIGPTGPQGPSLLVGTVETTTGPAVPGTVGPQGLTGPKGDPGGWIAGSALGTTDLNLIVTPGLYKQDNSGNATVARNYPKDAIGGALKVYDRVAPGASASIFQEYIPAVNSISGTPIYFIRYSYTNHTAWSPWRIYASSRVDQTAGRAIYSWDHLNDREQLTYGDTGLRVLTPDNGYVGTLYIRRVGAIVSFWGTLQRPPGGSLNGTFLAAIPAGFGPSVTAWVYQAIRHNGSSALFWLYRQNGAFLFTDSIAGNETDASQVRFQFNWDTNQTWPTTLPGTASGAIISN